MSALDQVTPLKPGDNVMVRFVTDHVVTDLIFVGANADVTVLTDGAYQFHVPNSSMLWLSKPLKENQ